MPVQKKTVNVVASNAIVDRFLFEQMVSLLHGYELNTQP